MVTSRFFRLTSCDKTGLDFPVFWIRSVDFAVQLCFRYKLFFSRQLALDSSVSVTLFPWTITILCYASQPSLCFILYRTWNFYFRVCQSGQRLAFELFWKIWKKAFEKFVFYYIKQIDSRVPLVCSCHTLTSSVIYHWADARHIGIYLTSRFASVHCDCSLIDHRWRQNVLRTKKWHTRR